MVCLSFVDSLCLFYVLVRRGRIAMEKNFTGRAWECGIVDGYGWR